LAATRHAKSTALPRPPRSSALQKQYRATAGPGIQRPEATGVLDLDHTTNGNSLAVCA